MEIELTEDQKKLLDILNDFIYDHLYSRKRADVITIGGYAGTGKTTMICEFRNQLKKRMRLSVAFLSFTGKATSVLNKKLNMTNAIDARDECCTIHKLIYRPLTTYNKLLKTHVIVGWARKDFEDLNAYYDLFIVDEASMVSKELFEDLRSFGVPIIAFGDHGQLPPIGDKFNLMEKPTFTLTDIHRQALTSPIIKLSKFVRKEGYIPLGKYSNEVFKLSWKQDVCKKIWDKVEYDDSNLQILCGFNTTRCNLNNSIREKLGYINNVPYPSEKLVCLSNNHYINIMNGQTSTVLFVMPEENAYRITMEIDNELIECYVSDKCFGQVQYTMYENSKDRNIQMSLAFEKGFKSMDYFDYGYTISVHKSQGSEWDKIILVEQRTPKWDDEYYAKWLYTAITRSKQKLFIISDLWI